MRRGWTFFVVLPKNLESCFVGHLSEPLLTAAVFFADRRRTQVRKELIVYSGKAVGLCIGAVRSSPAGAVLAEADEPLLRFW